MYSDTTNNPIHQKQKWALGWVGGNRPKFGSCYVHPALLLGHPANSEVAKLPFSNYSSGRRFFRKSSRNNFSGKFPEESSSGRLICVFRKYSQTTSGRTSSGMFPEEASSGRIPLSSGRSFFRKLVFFLTNILFCNNLLLIA